MAIEKTEGLVLRRTDYSNTSLIVGLYTKRYGRLDVIAKGARRDKSSFHGVLDLANHVQVVYYRHARSGLHTLSECSLLDDFLGLRTELFRFYAGSNVLELISSLTVADDRHLDLFELALDGLSALSLGQRPAASLVIFQTDLLRLLGYLPVFFECVLCGKNVLSDKKAFFSPLKGGALCRLCGSQATSKFAVGGDLLSRLHDLSDLSPAQADTADISDSECGRLIVILLKYFTFLLDREPRTARYLLDRSFPRTSSKKAPYSGRQ